MALPESNSFVNIDLLDGGSFIASTDKLHADVKSERFRLYNWAFHIFHPSTGEHIMWDLGISGDRADFNPWANKMMDTLPQCSGPRKSIPTQLSDLGVHPEQMSRILFSHAHWDHCHPIRDKFPSAKSYFGPGTREHCSPSSSPPGPDFQWEARFFDPESATESWEELDGQWTKFGPFDFALDFFGDGSLWIIQAPGHMPGNLCAVARTESGSWVLLGGDCCHSRGLLDGQFDIAIFELPNGESMSLHADIPAAKETIKRMKKLENDYGVHIALAHDASWMKEGKDQVLMSLLTGEIEEFVKGRLHKDESV